MAKKMNPINTPPEAHGQTTESKRQPPLPTGPLHVSAMRLPPPKAPLSKPRLQIAIRIEEPPTPTVVKITHSD